MWVDSYESFSETRKVRVLQIGRWPNRLRFVIWDHEIAGSSPVLPTTDLGKGNRGIQVRILFGNGLHIKVCPFGV